mgnify:FL=1
MQQLASPAGIGRSRQRRTSRYQESACIIRAPASEWYQWTPSPRQNKDVEVLLSLSPKNYPLGIKDVVNFGDFPIVWSNKNYRMIYLNMGHGDEEFIDGTQNLLLVNAFRWVVSKDKNGDPFLK